jgi:sulfonate transport system permease protein
LAVVLPFLLLAVWELAMRRSWIPASIFATPLQVWQSAVRLTSDGSLVHHSTVSLRRLGLGFVAGLMPAALLGTAVGYSRLTERLFAPTISVLAPIPVTGWIPIVIIIAGVDELSKVAVIAIGTFFPVYFATVNGIRNADPRLVEVARLYEKGPLTTLTRILLPGALDSMFLGMRSSLGLAWVLLIVAEVIASSDGIGWLMWDARNFARPADMIVGMVTAGVLGAGSAKVLAWVQRRLLFWRLTFEGAE